MSEGIIIETLIKVVFILIYAKLAGELFEKFGQSAVIGELLAGILLGPSLFNIISSENQIISFLAEIGVILLLFEVGLESSVFQLLKVGWTSAKVAFIGVFVPMLLGIVYFLFIGYNSTVALLVGATLTATSVGVTMRVLSDIKKVSSAEGQIILGAAIIDDVLGLIILSAIISIVGTGSVSVFGISKTVVFSVLFLVATLFIGIKFAKPIVSFVHEMKVRGAMISLSLAFAFILAITANFIGLATIVGSFAAGLVLENTERKEHILENIRPVSDIFVPMFFLLAGARIDLNAIHSGSLVLIMILFSIAIIGKLISGLGCGRNIANRLAVGIGMIPRGEVGLIFVTVGLTAGVINQELYAVLVIMIILTTLITPLLLRPVMLSKHVKA